jgi:3',5'-cyclic AMP phosphodiesterase CpdA
MIIHLSDLHIGLSEKEVANAKRLFFWIATDQPGTVVLITGDITDLATEEQLQEAALLIEELSETNPVLIVPGNHDYAWAGNILREDGWKNWQQCLGNRFGGSREIVDGLRVTKISNMAFFSVDSGDPRDEEISARGYISEALAEALKESLVKSWDPTRVVFLHHHPFDSGFFTKLHGSEIFMEAITGNCEILLFGHRHRFGIWEKRENSPMIVASHKSTDEFGECLLMGFVNPETYEFRLVPCGT